MERNIVKLDASDYLAALSELDLHAQALRKAPKSLLHRCLRLFNTPSKVCRIEAVSTKRATTTLALKPSDSFLDLLAALRASNFGRRIIKRKCHRARA